MKNKILKWIFGILGFSGIASSCAPSNNDDWGEQAAMYGCPMATYIANIEVKDGATDTPIEGIRVSSVFRIKTEDWDEEQNVIVVRELIDTITTALTNAEGKTTLQWSRGAFNNSEIVADDIDDEANGGKYNSASLTITTNSGDYVGGSGWDLGTATHNISFSLTKK
ncbi:MAG: radical SAM-associated putative lipoprotein [Tidjanibacter sp.]|nr:radical SAM-associated putative lipoprotein [Tidjanibacter sp.]